MHHLAPLAVGNESDSVLTLVLSTDDLMDPGWKILTVARARGFQKTRGSSGIYPGSSEPASDPTRALRAGLLRPDLVFVITFRDIVPRT